MLASFVMGGFHLFTLGNVPVSISPWYLLLLAFVGRRWGVAGGMIVAACVTIALLAHEFGHALVAKHFKLQPQILLHGFGGLTGHDRARRDRDEALIIAAGPLVGLLVGGLVYGLALYVPPTSEGIALFYRTMIEISFLWSGFNLLPIWPLDGGQLFRIGASKLLKPTRGEKTTHIVSIAVIVLVAVGSYYIPWLPSGPLLMVILAMTAFQNYQALQAGRSSEAPRRDNPFARELLERAERAYRDGNDDEAARLCHQLRAEGSVPPQSLARAWAILGVTTTRKGEYTEALTYLRRAPDTPDVVEATAQCLYQLDDFDALEALVKTKAFSRLPSETRDEILRVLSERERSEPESA